MAPPDLPDSSTSDALRAARGLEPDFAREQARQRVIAMIRGDPVAPLQGRYRLHTLLGSGAHGQVFDAWDLRLERRVALKVITDPDHSVREEARALARLETPGVVKIYELAETDDCSALVMQFVDGPRLDVWVRERRPGWRTVVETMVQIAQALHRVHEAGLVHGDIKPSNVLVDDGGRPVLVDFSLAGSPEDLAQPAGTPRYMAPEARTSAPTPRSDQYAFFVTLLTLLGAPSPQAVTPRRLGAIAARGLSEDAATRFPSMQAVHAALRSLLARRRRGFAAIAAATVVVAGLGWSSARQARCAWATRPTDLESSAASMNATTLPAGTDPTPLLTALQQATTKWSSAAEEACAAYGFSTLPPPAPPPCLESQRRRIALVDAVVAHDAADALAHAEALISVLPDPRQCATDPDLQTQGWSTDLDRAAFLDVREQLDRARLLLDVDPPAGAALLETIATSTTLPTCAWEPDLAELRGHRVYNAGRNDEAVKLFVETAAQAEACGRIPLQLAARTKVATHMSFAGHPEEAADWLRLADATLQGHPQLADERWRLDMSRGYVAYAQMRVEDAYEAFSAAEKELAARELPHDDATHKRIAMAGILGRPDAPQSARGWVDEQIARWGPGHPATARAWSLLGRVQVFARNLDESVAAHRAALEVFQRWGEGHALDRHTEEFFLATALQNSDPAQAAVLLQSYLDFMEREVPDSPTISEAMSLLAHILRNLERLDDARTMATRAAERLARQFGPDAAPTLLARGIQGELAAEQGDIEEGMEIACRSAEVFFGSEAGPPASGHAVLSSCLHSAEGAQPEAVAALLDRAWLDAAIQRCDDGHPACAKIRHLHETLRARRR